MCLMVGRWSRSFRLNAPLIPDSSDGPLLTSPDAPAPVGQCVFQGRSAMRNAERLKSKGEEILETLR